MNSKMQAAVVEQFGDPLVLQEWSIPEPGPSRILVRTEACGVCHTDVHAWRGDWPVKTTLPFIPGHEGIGVVVALGPGVTSVKEGDRVGVPWLYSACGHCSFRPGSTDATTSANQTVTMFITAWQMTGSESRGLTCRSICRSHHHRPHEVGFHPIGKFPNHGHTVEHQPFVSSS